MATGFPYSRTIVKIVSHVTVKKTGRTSQETRYYLSSQDADERTAEGWINLSRSHWAGVEIRNHWRRDATYGEDGTRMQQPRALVNLALLRSVDLRLLAEDGSDDWLPAQRERLACDVPALLRLIQTKL